MLDGWVAEFLKSAKTMSRLDSGNGDYVAEVSENIGVMVSGDLGPRHLPYGLSYHSSFANNSTCL